MPRSLRPSRRCWRSAGPTHFASMPRRRCRVCCRTLKVIFTPSPQRLGGLRRSTALAKAVPRRFASGAMPGRSTSWKPSAARSPPDSSGCSTSPASAPRRSDGSGVKPTSWTAPGSHAASRTARSRHCPAWVPRRSPISRTHLSSPSRRRSGHPLASPCRWPNCCLRNSAVCRASTASSMPGRSAVGVRPSATSICWRPVTTLRR